MAKQTSEILTLAATIAARVEGQGQEISASEALERALSAQIHLEQLKVLAERVTDWDQTVAVPELTTCCLGSN